jgi:dethiobiotin synthetase
MSRRAIAVSATGTDVGKTFVACAVIEALRARSRPIDAFKPVLSGFVAQDAADSDAGRLLLALGRPLGELEAMSPLRFAAPLAPPSAARAEGVTLTLAQLVNLCRARNEQHGEGLLLIEGAGGIASPIAEDATNLDLFAVLSLPVLLVGGSYLGAISHALTAIAAVKSRGLALAGMVVSESEGEAPPLDEITQALATFAPGVRVFVASRRESFDAAALADALYAGA